MSNQVPCYVVNLASATARKEAMEATLRQHGIQATFFSAVDGRLMDEAQIDQHLDREKAEREYGVLTRAEIGTSLSHIYIYRDMVERNIPYGVILEDDVCLSDDFSRLIDIRSADSLTRVFKPNDATMIQLSHVRRAFRGTAKPVGSTGRSVVQPYGGVWLTSGYFITLAAAKNLSTALYPVWTVADHWMAFQEKGLLTLHALTPNAVWESAEAQNSSIAPDRRPRRKNSKTLLSRLRRLREELILKPFFVKRLPRAGS